MFVMISVCKIYEEQTIEVGVYIDRHLYKNMEEVLNKYVLGRGYALTCESSWVYFTESRKEENHLESVANHKGKDKARSGMNQLCLGLIQIILLMMVVVLMVTVNVIF